MKKISLFLFLLIPLKCFGADMISIPKISLGMSAATKPQDVVTTLQILLIFTVLTLAPSIIIMTTCFLRIVIVLHFVRQAMATQQMPPNQVLIGLALFLTFFIMHPTFDKVINEGIQPYLNKEIKEKVMLERITNPIREYMLKQTREEDIKLFLKASKTKIKYSRKELPVWIVTPAYMLSELTRGFEIGILIFIPFILIDMVVATTLMSLGMMMLPPVMISMPFKLLIFVMVNGWGLIIGSLLKSFK